MSPNDDPLIGAIFGDSERLSLRDLCRLCAVEERRIVEFVEEGVLETQGRAVTEWHFSGAALARARLALRLQRDFELNLAGVALVIELMEELKQLRRQQERQ